MTPAQGKPSTPGTTERREPEQRQCNCIKETEAKLLEKCQGSDDMGTMRPRNAVIEGVHCDNVPYMMPSFKRALTIAFSASWKTDKGKLKETKIRVTASHCPFCGKEFK